MTKLLPSEAKRIIIGRVGAPHGIKGDIRIIPLTDFPDRFHDMDSVMVGDEMLHIETVKKHGKFLLIRFKRYATREEAMKLTGKVLTISKEELVPLNDDEFYVFDIIGLDVFDDIGNKIGVVNNVMRTGSNDVYQIFTLDNRELLVPAIKRVVKSIVISEGKMVIDVNNLY